MLILASQSPRRREILRNAGIAFEARPSGIEEEREAGEAAAGYAERLARDKAAAVEAMVGEWVLAADTIVVCGEVVLEKPASQQDAIRMLRMLSGRWHEVMTGVCVRQGNRSWSEVEVTRVRFVEMSDAEMAEYAESGEPMDKAGGYAIQGLASKFIDRVEGCYFNVVGLPVSRVVRMLREAGYSFRRA
jgi:septum formation protein